MVRRGRRGREEGRGGGGRERRRKGEKVLRSGKLKQISEFEL